MHTINNIISGTSNTSASLTTGNLNSLAYLVLNETAPDYSVGALGFAPTAGASITFTPVGGASTSVYQVPLTATSTGYAGEAVWEVVQSDPTALDTLDFGVYYIYSANQSTNTAASGTYTVGQSFAPTPTGAGLATTFTAASAATATSGPIPRFEDTTANNTHNLLTISPCQTPIVQSLTLACAGGTGQVGVAYSSSLVASGGVPPYTYSIASGWLPAGLTLNTSTGAITGTPTTAETYSFGAQAVDSSGNPASNTVTSNCPIAITSTPGPPTMDAPFQVRGAANLSMGDSDIHFTNVGANGASALGPGLGETGNICVNIYAFDPNEELIDCCSCNVTPDQTRSLSVLNDILSNTATGVRPSSVTIKLLATEPGGGFTSTNCNNAAASAASATIVAGMAAWGTTLHATPVTGVYANTETPFTPATLSAGELTSLGNQCSNIVGSLSGFGICASCRTTAFGGAKQ